MVHRVTVGWRHGGRCGGRMYYPKADYLEEVKAITSNLSGCRRELKIEVWRGYIMTIEPMIVTDKIGRSIVLRNAEEDDAASLIKFMKITTGETPFLIREPDEFSLTIEQEKIFIKEQKDNPRALMLIATVDEKHIGNCSLNGMGQYRRYAHRCEVAIALYQKYCGTGIGKLMLERILTIAKKAGYEQAELEVIATNEYAINLYRKLGFATVMS